MNDDASDRPARVVPYILATAGHVDHGKSSIVRAITGEDPDRLPEEKTRGITIDLGFAHWFSDHPTQPGTTLQIGIVDVPGHEDFVKNMVAGVGAIDAALLVIAADDGWMPQTQEHLEILYHLGVRRLIVAINKVDLVPDEAAIVASVRERLRAASFEDVELVATSAKSVHGLESLKATILASLARCSPRADLGRPRLSVDRAFSLRGVGTVVTGTLTDGAIEKGDTLLLQPDGVRVRVRGLQSARRDVQRVHPGMRVAVQLADIDVGERGARRGTVLASPDVGRSVQVVDVVLERMPGGVQAIELRDALHVNVHQASQRAVGTVRLLDGVHDAPSTVPAIARLTLERPMHLVVGDRMVLRSASERSTLCGARVLDVSVPLGRAFRFQPDSVQGRFLKTRADGVDDLRTLIASRLARDGLVERSSLRAEMLCSTSACDEVIESMKGDGLVHVHDQLLVDRVAWERLRARAEGAIDHHHKQHPEQSGLPLDALRDHLIRHAAGNGFRGSIVSLVESVVTRLTEEGFVRRGAAIARRTHAIALPARLQAAGTRCRAVLTAAGLDPPSRKELCAGDVAVQAVKFLVANGEAIELSADLVMDAAAYAKAVGAIREYLASRGTATVSELKTLLGSSRRVMVPLLERLDRTGVTRRVGDLRTLAVPSNAGRVLGLG